MNGLMTTLSHYNCLRFLCIFILLLSLNGFSPSSFQSTQHGTAGRILSSSSSTIRRFVLNKSFVCRRAKNDEDDDEEDVTLSDGDWRAFRAKLVMGEKNPSASDATTTAVESSSSETQGDDDDDKEIMIGEIMTDDLDGIGSIFGEDTAAAAATTTATIFTPLDPSQWAYDSGDVIEQGAVILGGVEQEFGFGLRQQYFHKTVILVLDHSATFTKGIILNRPTDLMLKDDVNIGKQWRVYFGGDVEGTGAQRPDIICLHSLKDERAIKASNLVMNDIQWTTFENAKKLVKEGVASVSDFWTFVGYAGWGPDQLKGELERNSWYMVATDSQTLLQELARQADDPRDAGLETWTLLMNMIGRSETAKEHATPFDDLMLKEWAFQNLLSEAGDGGAGKQQRDPNEFNTRPQLVQTLLDLIKRKGEPTTNIGEPKEGALVAASGVDRSPFLLEKQEYHKSIVLILKEDELATIGVILNRVSTKGVDVQIDDKKTGGRRVVNIPLRFGGPYSIQGSQSLLWIHCKELLRQAKIGHPIGGDEKNGIWKCTAEDVTKAIAQGLARPEEFLVVSGVSVWPKMEGIGHGMQGELELKNFEPVSAQSSDDVWSILLKQQQLLKESNFIESLKFSEEAWFRTSSTSRSSSDDDSSNAGMNPLGGLGENFDEEDDSFVFKSDYKVSKLSDDALRGWCATFLLGLPNYEI
mmetsp:Transcript_4553/g.6564  ORF Transcript_4553/g.6564 Transcript_4553/m.6564 type:complete len:697 (+) Transcript_4553:60-2150(+)